MANTLKDIVPFSSADTGLTFFGIAENGKVKQIIGNDLQDMAWRRVGEYRSASYDPEKDRGEKFRPLKLIKMVDGEFKYVLASEGVNKISDEEYDNTFKAIKARSVEDEFFSAVTGLYASVRGYLGW
ncbi:MULTISPECIES: hypothetical protein [unclassified Pseudomonas]|uniref:hypothetical protein n=1 Tax=unclassified Pseudomonas TaxID=196821 RepID=UPI001A9F3E06|nr:MULTISPECIES: hypothetical protein [unclassified Pseudomonas]